MAKSNYIAPAEDIWLKRQDGGAFVKAGFTSAGGRGVTLRPTVFVTPRKSLVQRIFRAHDVHCTKARVDVSVTDKLPVCRENSGRIVLDEMYQFVGPFGPEWCHARNQAGCPDGLGTV